MSYYYILLLCVLYIVSSLSYCAEVDPEPLQQLHTAVERKETDVVRTLLLQHQDKINTPLPIDTPYDGLTLLHKAARHQHLLMIKLLIKHQAFIDPLDSTGSTPLHLAFTPTRVEVALIGGPVPNGRATIRHLENKNLVNVVYELVKNGAAIHFPNNDGQTPMDLAENHPAAKTKMLELYAERQTTITSLIVTTLDIPGDVASLIAEFTG